jgi:diketogulonate reductase-like aldo/keto reductase
MEYSGVPMEETWRAMCALKARGQAREIGVCNITTSGLRDILSYPDCEPPAVNQVGRSAV